MQLRAILFSMVLPVFLLASCQSQPDTPTLTVVGNSSPVPAVATGEGNFIVDPLQMDDETGVARGRVISALTGDPLAGTVVALAQITRQDGEAVMALNTASSPMNTTDVDGYFIIPQVPPGEFVVVVGDPYEKHEIIENPDTRMAQTYFVEAGRVTEIGELNVDIGE